MSFGDEAVPAEEVSPEPVLLTDENSDDELTEDCWLADAFRDVPTKLCHGENDGECEDNGRERVAV